MISNAFKGAYTSQVSARTQGIDTIASGVKSAAAIIAAVSGGLNKGVGTVMKKFGLGGQLMASAIQEKQETSNSQMISRQDIMAKLGGNPINNTAIKQLNTVFDTLTKLNSSGIMNKKGNIESSLGEIDPNSELGQKIAGGLK
jgi:hypothetical protein